MTQMQSGLGMEVTKELLGAITVEDLQRLLEQKQQEARASKIERRNAVSSQLQMAQDELERLEAEIGVETQQRPIVRRQSLSGGKRPYQKSTRGCGSWGKACAEALQWAGKPMTAGEIGAAIHAPLGGANIATYLKPLLASGKVRRSGVSRFYKYQWVGGDL